MIIDLRLTVNDCKEKPRKMVNQYYAENDVILIQKFLSTEESDLYFNEFLSNINWKHEPILMFGTMVMQPRLTAWYADTGVKYRYSGVTQVPNEWTLGLLKLKTKIENHIQTPFNSVLMNQYRNHLDSMGWHRDNEKELGTNPTIASISLGETRSFLLRKHQQFADPGRRTSQSIDLTHGSLLIMKGNSQTNWEHCVPKTKANKNCRINLTFRNIKGL